MRQNIAVSIITLMVGAEMTQCGSEDKKNFSTLCDGGTPVVMPTNADAGSRFTIEIESPPVTADVRGIVRARVQATHPAGIKFVLFCLSIPTNTEEEEEKDLSIKMCEEPFGFTLAKDSEPPYEAAWDTNEMILIAGQPERRDHDGLYYFGFWFVAQNGESLLYWHALTVKNNEAPP